MRVAADPGWSARLSAGELLPWFSAVAAGASMPSLAATEPVRRASTFARIRSRTRRRISSRLTLPSSNENASMMCCCSYALMLFQNSWAWLKWSPKLGLRRLITSPDTGWV